MKYLAKIEPCSTNGVSNNALTIANQCTIDKDVRNNERL